MEGKSIATIDIESSSKMEHNSTDRRGGSSTTGAIPIRHIHVGGGNDSGSGNGADNTDGFIVLSYSLSYWRRTTNQTKEDILQHRVVCVKSERGPEGLRELDIHHSNSTKVLSQDLGDVKHFVTKNLEGGSNSTKYTDIQYEYVGNLTKINFLEACIMAYNTRDPFLPPHWYTSVPVHLRTIGGTMRLQGSTCCPTGRIFYSM